MPNLPEADVAQVQQWCRARVPGHVRDQVRVEADVSDRHVTIVECRPRWQADADSSWTRSRDRNLRFHQYDGVSATARVDELLAEIDRDPTAIFWG